MTGRNTLGDLQRGLTTSAIGGAHGITIHLGIVHRRHIQLRLLVCRQHAACPVEGRYGLGVGDRANRAEEKTKRFLHAQHGDFCRHFGCRDDGLAPDCNASVRTQQCRRLEPRVTGNIALDRADIGVHHLNTLRQGFNMLETSGPFGITAQRFTQGLTELRR
jgi:hypothetical protein